MIILFNEIVHIPMCLNSFNPFCIIQLKITPPAVRHRRWWTILMVLLILQEYPEHNNKNKEKDDYESISI